MEKHTTDESVKTGLQTESNSKPDKLPIAGAETETSNEDALKETDEDDLVHQQNDMLASLITNEEEKDADELVHSIVSFPIIRPIEFRVNNTFINFKFYNYEKAIYRKPDCGCHQETGSRDTC